MKRFRFTHIFLLAAVLGGCSHSSSRAQITTDALLDTIQHTAFNFFWQEVNPANGLIKDRSSASPPSSIACVGFGLSAICIGVDHGWVARDTAARRVLTTLNTFWTGPQGVGATGYIGCYGLFYHMLKMNTAVRDGTSELSTIDTALLLAGIIDAKQYFTGNDPLETTIRALADSIYYRMDWDLMRNFNPGIMMQWTPEQGFSHDQWVGYNEASIMYILALGSPTHPVDYSAWQEWTSGYRWSQYYGYWYVAFPPLFGHQYSQCWLDLRNISDDYMRNQGITYFENSRRATLAQIAYSVRDANPQYLYSDSLWGITASDHPWGYNARGAPPPQDDDGTIAPTAPGGSIAFAPEECIRVLRNMWENYGSQVWIQYGFRDAFSLYWGWYDTDVIGLDQGTMMIMIENYRTQRVWNRFMRNPDIQRGLQAAHFLPVTGVKEGSTQRLSFALDQNYPNPFNPSTTIRYSLGKAVPVSLKVYDVLGREVASLVDETKVPGEYAVSFNANGLPSGVYFAKMRAGSFSAVKTLLLLK